MALKSDSPVEKKRIPIYFYFGGVFSVFVIFFNIICFENLGISLTVAITFLSQTLISSVIDHYGILGVKKTLFNKKKLIGLSLIATGVIVMIFM
jgi:transporter family-2 protein